MNKTILVVVGACAVDTILTVPHYPEEDSKLRAVSVTKRRGGNGPNSLEVLLQLVDEYADESGKVPERPPGLECFLIATLPARDSPQMPFIASSFNVSRHADETITAKPPSGTAGVHLSQCIYREEYAEPVSSYIISSQATSSRTIVNHNELPEMTYDEFVEATQGILPSQDYDHEDVVQIWFHFEGRIPHTLLDCIRYLRNHPTFKAVKRQIRLRVSVELEKPHREGLQELVFEADVIFYSKAWAEAEGYKNGAACLQEQAKVLCSRDRTFHATRTLICTWGDQGACALELPGHGSSRSALVPEPLVHSSAYIAHEQAVLDTVGAGDTFIAGILFAFLCRDYQQIGGPGGQSVPVSSAETILKRPIWTLEQKLDFANGLAGRKVLQHGFRALARQARSLLDALDSDARR